ncbi:MAG: phage portal protein, partial [Pseudomonadota bacterium]
MPLRLFRAADTAVGERKASAAGPVLAFHGTGRAMWSPRDQVSLTRTGYGENVIAFRAVRMVADAAAAIPLVLSEGGMRQSEHAVLRLLAQPNPGQDGRSFLEAVYGHIQLTGNAYLEAAAHDSLGLPVELHALRPDRMRVVPGPDGWPEAFEYRVGKAMHRWRITPEARPVL